MFQHRALKTHTLPHDTLSLILVFYGRLKLVIVARCCYHQPRALMCFKMQILVLTTIKAVFCTGRGQNFLQRLWSKWSSFCHSKELYCLIDTLPGPTYSEIFNGWNAEFAWALRLWQQSWVTSPFSMYLVFLKDFLVPNKCPCHVKKVYNYHWNYNYISTKKLVVISRNCSLIEGSSLV